MDPVIQQAKSSGVSALIGALGITAQLTDLELWLKVAIGMVTLFILGTRSCVAWMDLRKRLRQEREETCSENSSSRPPMA